MQFALRKSAEKKEKAARAAKVEIPAPAETAAKEDVE